MTIDAPFATDNVTAGATRLRGAATVRIGSLATRYRRGELTGSSSIVTPRAAIYFTTCRTALCCRTTRYRGTIRCSYCSTSLCVSTPITTIVGIASSAVGETNATVGVLGRAGDAAHLTLAVGGAPRAAIDLVATQTGRSGVTALGGVATGSACRQASRVHAAPRTTRRVGALTATGVCCATVLERSFSARSVRTGEGVVAGVCVLSSETPTAVVGSLGLDALVAAASAQATTASRRREGVTEPLPVHAAASRRTRLVAWFASTSTSVVAPSTLARVVAPVGLNALIASRRLTHRRIRNQSSIFSVIAQLISLVLELRRRLLLGTTVFAFARFEVTRKERPNRMRVPRASTRGLVGDPSRRLVLDVCCRPSRQHDL